MDTNLRRNSNSAGDNQVINQVHEGMTVLDVDSTEIGTVKVIRMGDPEAVTTQGQSREDLGNRAPFLFDADDDDPDLPAQFRSSMLRVGYIKVERGGFLGIGEKNHYVRADRIAEVSGDRVLLSVTESRLPLEDDDNDPLDT